MLRHPHQQGPSLVCSRWILLFIVPILLGIAVVDVFLLQRLISKERHIQQLIKESNIYSKEASSNNLPRRSEIISTTSLANKKRYITFALYGNDTMFTIGAIRNAMLAEYIYPGWIVRVYVDNSVPLPIIAQLSAAKAEIVDVSARDELKGIDGRFWRFLIADDPDVDAFVSRDTDSRISLREKCAVDEWLASGKGLHSMRDHPAHKQPIMAGMFGLRPSQLFGNGKPTILELITHFEMSGRKRDDQVFLAAEVWTRVNATKNFLAHDAFYCTWDRFPGATSFPCPRKYAEYVGQKVKGMHDKTSTTLKIRSAPMECRRRPEWVLG